MGPAKSLTGDTRKVLAREVRYTVYAENLELALKLMACQRTISLIDKRDPKYKRMFITAIHNYKAAPTD